MRLRGRLRRVFRDGYQRTLEFVDADARVYWIGAIEFEENNPLTERYVVEREYDLLVKIQYVNKIVLQEPSVEHSFRQPIAQSPYCTLATTVSHCVDSYSFYAILEGEPTVLVELEKAHTLKAGQALQFAGELAVVED